MSLVAFPRIHATTASVLLATVALSGCSILGGLQSSVDISKLPNIPEGQKQQLISQMQSASGSENQGIAAKAKALSKMVGTKLVAMDPPADHRSDLPVGSEWPDRGEQGRQYLPVDVGHRLLASGPGYI